MVVIIEFKARLIPFPVLIWWRTDGLAAWECAKIGTDHTTCYVDSSVNLARFPLCMAGIECCNDGPICCSLCRMHNVVQHKPRWKCKYCKGYFSTFQQCVTHESDHLECERIARDYTKCYVDSSVCLAKFPLCLAGIECCNDGLMWCSVCRTHNVVQCKPRWKCKFCTRYFTTRKQCLKHENDHYK